jgi:hypothetical protein
VEHFRTVVDTDQFQEMLPDGLTLGRLIYGKGGQRKVFEADDGGTKIVIKLMAENHGFASQVFGECKRRWQISKTPAA